MSAGDPGQTTQDDSGSALRNAAPQRARCEATGPSRAGSRSLRVNTLYAIAGTSCYHAGQLGVVVLLAKFASAEIQGQYFLALAIATPVVMFFGLELRAAFVSDAGNVHTFGTYDRLCRLMMWPAGVILAGVVVWRTLGAEDGWGPPLMLAGLFAGRVAWALSEVGWGTYQRRERLDLLAASVALRGVALLLPFAVLVPACHGLAARNVLAPARVADAAAVAALCYALGGGALLVYFDRPRVRDGQLWDVSTTGHALRALARQTLPLGAVALIINLCDSYPRLVFERGSVVDGQSQLGYFGSLAYITLIGNLVVIQAGTAAANRLSAFYQGDLAAFTRLGLRLLLLALLIGGAVLVVALTCGRWLLAALYTAEHARFHVEFCIIVSAHCLALLTNVLGIATTQMRLFGLQVPAQVLTLVATVIAAETLIPGSTPVRGAAWTVVIRAVVQFVLYAGCVGVGLARKKGKSPAAEH